MMIFIYKNIYLKNNVKNITTIIIGLSPNECGSTHIYQILNKSLNDFNYNIINPKDIELNYWTNCIIPFKYGINSLGIIGKNMKRCWNI